MCECRVRELGSSMHELEEGHTEPEPLVRDR